MSAVLSVFRHLHPRALSLTRLTLGVVALALMLAFMAAASPVAAAATWISGTVTDEWGDPLAGIDVTLSWYDYYLLGFEGGEVTQTTGADGTYIFSANTHEEWWWGYALEADDPTGARASASKTIGYLPDWLPAMEWSPTLAPLGSIYGTVTAAAGYAPLEGVRVEVYLDGGDGSRSYLVDTMTDALGRYIVSGLGFDTYFARFVYPGYVAEWYPDTRIEWRATPLVLQDDQTSLRVDEELEPGATLVGRLLAPGGTPAAGVAVEAWRDAPFYGVHLEDSGTTGADGEFSIADLPQGQYALRFEDPEGRFATEHYVNHITLWSADWFGVGAGAVTDIGDHALAYGGRITGTVSGSVGALDQVHVVAYLDDPELGDYVPVADAAADVSGAYELAGLRAGEYVVEFQDHAVNYYWQYYDGAETWEEATPVTVGAGETVTGIDALMEYGASLSGTVTNAGGEPVAGVEVRVEWLKDGEWTTDVASTNHAGYYFIWIRHPGTYYVHFVPPAPYADEWWDDQSTQDSANAIVLGWEEQRTGVDAVLSRGTSISGTVNNIYGDPISDVVVRASWQVDGAWSSRTTKTLGDGTYSIAGLAPGSYRVSFEPSAPMSKEWWDNRPTRAQADPIVLAAGEERTGVDAVLGTGSSIFGTVTDTFGAPLSDVLVECYVWDGGCWSYAGRESTEGDGRYRLDTLAPGTYVVGFRSWRFVSEWYDDVGSFYDATQITVDFDQDVTGIDAALSEGSTISGTVSGADGPALAGVKVTAWFYEPESDYWDKLDQTQTRADGSYTLDHLQGGTYRLQFGGKGSYIGEWYDSAYVSNDALPVEVPRDVALTGFDAVLELGATVSGRVSGDAGGLSGIRVAAYQPDGHGDWRRVSGTTTDAAGVYAIGGLSAGTCRVRFGDPAGRYLAEYWDDAESLATAADVAVNWGQVTSGVDAVLTSSSQIMGTVTAPSGSAVAEATVEAFTSDGDGGWDSAGSATTDGTGRYDITGLRAGTYRVHFADSSGGRAPEWWNDVTEVSQADDIVLSVGQTKTGVNAELSVAARVSGVVTAEGEGPLAGITVTAYTDALGHGWQVAGDAVTDESGSYVIGGLGTGPCRLFFCDEVPSFWDPETDGGVYLDEWYDDAATLGKAEQVQIVAGRVTTGIDATLTRGGTIAGTVTYEEGGAVYESWVSVYRRVDGKLEYVADASTDATGTYEVGPIPSGEFLVKFTPEWGHGYIDEWYDDSAIDDGATPVSVIAGGTTPAIDAVLGKGASISGVVTDAGGQPLDDVWVYLGRPDGDGWSFSLEGSTDALGRYECREVRAGDYKVEFYPRDDIHAAEFWDDVRAVEQGAVVSVAGGDVVTGIDAQLEIAGTVSGTVTDAAGRPLYHAVVVPYVLTSDGRWVGDPYGVLTDLYGRYTCEQLKPGTYRIGFSALEKGYADVFWDGAGTPEAAQDVVVTAGETVKGVDARMGPGETLTGTVTDSAGSGIGNVDVAVYRKDGGSWAHLADTTTDASGTYRIGDLGAATYRVRFEDYAWRLTRYTTEWYEDAGSLDAATDVDVVPGKGAVVNEDLVHRAEIVGLGSGTHPDEATWYTATDAALAWTAADPTGVVGYGWLLDQSPGTIVTKELTSASSEALFDGLSEGVWYFHVRGVVASLNIEGGWWWPWTPPTLGDWDADWGPTAHYALHVDTTAPTTQVNGADDTWQAGSVGLTFTAEDALSGMEGGFAKTEYKVDAGAWTTGTSVEVAGDGVHTVLYRSTDNAGNVEADKSVEVKVDSVAPTTSVTGADDVWHREAVALSFTAIDVAGGSGMTGGLAKTEYKIDDGPWRTGTVVGVGGNGVHTVSYRSTDAAGNAEAPKTATVKIDNQTPTTTQTGADGAWRTSPVTVTFTPDDGAGSGMVGGLARTEYALDGGPWTTGPSVVISADGTHTVSYRSTDTVGNMEGEKSATVKIDGAAPTTAQTGADDLWHNVAVTVAFTPTDNAGGSGMSGGLAKTEYKLDAGVWTAGTSVTVGAAGVHTILYRSTDAAGNVEAVKTATVKIETAAPITVVSGADDLWHRLPVTLTFTATDADAGVASTEYSLDGGVTWTQGTTVVVNGLAQGGVDGPRAVQYRSIDLLGKTEPLQTVTVNLDTQRPTTKAPSKATVQRFRRVTLKYEVVDPLPNAGKARVRISIRNKNDRVVVRLDWRTVTVNEEHGWRYLCKLQPGTYSFEVYARDMAGNKQVKVGSNKLTVK